jgi:DNA-binding MarR family transcriptional regulator/GNAT superfamily N-acetyltransferase
MEFEEKVEIVRRFNRFYTKQIGLLHDGLLHSRYSLTQARVLYELAHLEDPTASELRSRLDLDAGYVSRILRGFEKEALLKKKRSAHDGRKQLLRLTAKGRKAFEILNARSQAEIGDMLRGLPERDQDRLLGGVGTIMSILQEQPEDSALVLRPHRQGDIGWITYRHAVLYAEEFGWDEEFESLVAEILADFLKNYDSRRERSWIAEIGGEFAGCIFITNGGDGVAKLRLLLVEPRARGRGVGGRLVEECVRFARGAGYRMITLYTNHVLLAARKIYERAGFRVVESWDHHSYGHDLTGENWELDLVERPISVNRL